MKSKRANLAFEKIRAEVHQWKPIPWASYDDDKPDLDPADTDYDIAKSMLADELDSTIKSVVRQLPRVNSESDMSHVLHRTLRELEKKVDFDDCQSHGSRIFWILRESGVI